MKDKIIEAVKRKFDKRSKLGIKKYGTTLAKNKNRDKDKLYWLKMAQEEAMDLVNYLECEIRFLSNKTKKR